MYTPVCWYMWPLHTLQLLHITLTYLHRTWSWKLSRASFLASSALANWWQNNALYCGHQLPEAMSESTWTPNSERNTSVNIVTSLMNGTRDLSTVTFMWHARQFRTTRCIISMGIICILVCDCFVQSEQSWKPNWIGLWCSFPMGIWESMAVRVMIESHSPGLTHRPAVCGWEIFPE